MKRRNFFTSLGIGAFLASSMSVAWPANLGKIDRRLKELGITLPKTATPLAAYVTFRISGNLVYIAGQIPIHSAEHPAFGRVGQNLTTEQGYQAARTTGLNILAQLKNACNGDLDRVVQCLQMQGTVTCTDDYKDSSKVINGASELFRDVFGDSGLAARAVTGANALPGGFVCEISSIWEINMASKMKRRTLS